ncbi:type II toxin-antitoxin system VapC family toxin [Aquabacterium sp.]|uniref:type II toxin-antitoxin system VapC family toxin n=1 Tax=Aquabacterium sp. TaxID=1872578 RepID=UPI0024894DD0|nr:type II toxin-antitoxin system VapC family toxin [Aquabacterium sp.]MDI1258103.1 type II toxin-antitoxin system VapC family toxin [Aquabacterium sp.]
MIVVDSNILACLYLPGDLTAQAEQLLAEDPDWVAPPLWRSEFRNILAGYIRRGALTLDQACALQLEAEGLLSGREYDVDSHDVLELVTASECSAYDCEFVALAKKLGVKLATMDKKVLRNFPEGTISIDSVSH